MIAAAPDRTIETERLIMRPPSRLDWPAYARFMETEPAKFFAGFRNTGRAWRSFGTLIWHWIDRGFGPWAVTARGHDDCIGIVGPKFPPGWPEGELTWIVFGDTEGRGIASEAARAARADVYHRPGWTTAVSYIEPENTRSVALAERLGAQRDDTARLPGGPVRAYRHPAPEARQ